MVFDGKALTLLGKNANLYAKLDAPGTIDPGYRGELSVILLNLGPAPYTVHAQDRIAQMVVARYEVVEWVERELAESRRGAGGFGSSGR